MNAVGTHLILGTAGHVDHGKTALVEALTGYNCDTHEEEKRRGITIHLGFTHLCLDNNRTIGIVDVPGHADFIRTMVAGASGMDAVLLVVAADSGVMPQTREHLHILELLGVRSGLVVLTRVDLVEPELIAVAREELSQVLKGTFLERAPVLDVSSKTGSGLESLLKAIARLIDLVGERAPDGVFRMFIDRVFSVRGFGTVVTGSVQSGTVSAGDNVYLLPGARELRIRRLERFGNETETVRAGDRAAINLAGLEQAELRRGMVIASSNLACTSRVDARISALPGVEYRLWSNALFLLGTYEAQARIHLLHESKSENDRQALVQIHLPVPCAARRGDRFVLRSTSADMTIGGGVIIDAFPLNHRRRREQLIRRIETVSAGKLIQVIREEIEKERCAISVESLAVGLNAAAADIETALHEDYSGELVVFGLKEQMYVDTKQRLDAIAVQTLARIRTWHKRNPLESRGLTLASLPGTVNNPRSEELRAQYEFVLSRLERERLVKRTGDTWAAFDHDVRLTATQQTQIDTIRNYLRACGLQAPLTSGIMECAQTLKLDESGTRQILRYLAGRGEVYLIEDTFLYAPIVDTARATLLRALRDQPQGVTVAEFRDCIGANRKLCLLLLARFDGEGVTRREGDVRVITETGLQLFHNNYQKESS